MVELFKAGDIMIVQGKKGPINIELKYFEDDRYYRAEAISESGQVMGYVTFKQHTDNPRTMWLQKIETHKEFQGLGVGDALLSVMEYTTLQSRKTSIDGKFYPDNEFAKPFYEHRGYDITKDGYETYVGKYLNDKQKKRITEEIAPTISGYSITEVTKEEESQM